MVFRLVRCRLRPLRRRLERRVRRLGVVHMGAHALGAAAYAARAAELADDARQNEIRWQLDHAPEAVRSALRSLPAAAQSPGQASQEHRHSIKRSKPWATQSTHGLRGDSRSGGLSERSRRGWSIHLYKPDLPPVLFLPR